LSDEACRSFTTTGRSRNAKRIPVGCWLPADALDPASAIEMNISA
jgi:hypothetical protein